MHHLIFVTGTSTGVGKTVAAGLVVWHLRSHGIHSLAVKPFSTGSRGDARILRAMQGNELSLPEVNPFFFQSPVAPAVAAPQEHKHVALQEVLGYLREISSRCACLVVEGCGGLLTPLGEQYTLADLIGAFKGASVLLVAPDKLGSLNHTLLCVRALHRQARSRLNVTLMAQARPDRSSKQNARFLRRWLAPIPVAEWPYFGPKCGNPEGLKKNYRKVKKTLAPASAMGIFTTLFENGIEKAVGRKRKF